MVCGLPQKRCLIVNNAVRRYQIVNNTQMIPNVMDKDLPPKLCPVVNNAVRRYQIFNNAPLKKISPQ